MLISTLTGKCLGLLGLGREGLATLAALRTAGHQGEVLVLGDVAPAVLPTGCRYVTPAEAGRVLPALDVVIRSPGFAPAHPLRRLLDSSNCAQTTATCLFLRETRDAGVCVIGITASKGKSTISALTQAGLLAAGKPALLLGNIGQPALAQLEPVLRDKPLVVMELSSYQCADLAQDYGPPLAAIGALFPEHLDYHGGFAGYLAAKLRIADTQRAGDALVCDTASWP